MKHQKHIEIIHSTNGDLISLSAKSLRSVHGVLAQHYSDVGISVVNNMSDLRRVVALKPDLVFLGAKQLVASPEQSPVWISSYLEQHGVNYTGSAKIAIERESNKLLAKNVVASAGLQTPAAALFESMLRLNETVQHMQYPLFVKPSELGGGKGIDVDSVVQNNRELREKITNLQSLYRGKIMIEEYLPGREFSVAIMLNQKTDKLMIMPLELTPKANSKGDFILDYATKTGDTEQVTAVTDKVLARRIAAFATEVFKALDARDYGRIDVRLDAAGSPHFIEANLVPGLGADGGYFARAWCIGYDMDYEEVILRIASLGFHHELAGNELLMPAT